MLNPFYTDRRDPFALMRSLMSDMDLPQTTTAQTSFPPVNVWQGEDAVAITAEIPGVELSDIDITVNNNILMISGERKPPETPEASTWHRRERGYGKFSRAVRLPFDVDESKVEARFQNGVLRIAAGRPEEDLPRKIKIKAA